jgi:uncharacterized lipoprotein YddW (UPF0748 family)
MRLILTLLLLIQLPLCAADYPIKEIRAVWISTIFGMDWPTKPANTESARRAQKQELCDQLDILKAANFNVVFLQVRLRGDLIYPSAIEPVSRFISGKTGSNPGYDPLAFAIEECRKRGLECHAWFVTYPLGTEDYVKRSGNSTPVKRRPDLCKLHNGEWYMDPGLPGTSDYILSLVKELVNNYDIDGIHFDYIRYPDHPTGFPDEKVYARYGKNKSLQEWRQDNITRMVERIYEWVKATKPWVQVSSAPLGKYAPLKIAPNAGQTGLSVYQDAQKWLKNDIQDFIVPMLYYRNLLFYPFVNNWMLNKSNRYIVAGLGLYRTMPDENWPVEEITRQIDYVRTHNLDGVSFFRASQIFRNHKGICDSLKNNYFRYPALLPPLTWANGKRPSPPTDLKIVRRGDSIHISWICQDDDDRLTYTIYGAASGIVDSTDPADILATGIRSREVYFPAADEDQGYAFRVTASNRYHIESLPSGEVYYYSSRYQK